MKLSRFLFPNSPDAQFEVTIPPEMRQGMQPGNIAPRISRNEALQVPAVLRSRNLICGTLARLPVHIRDGERNIVHPTTFLDQIDRDIPNVVTYALTYEDLLFEGTAWWQVTEFGWHGYPTYATHLDPSRVGVSGWLSPVQEMGQAYGQPQVHIDGKPVPDNEVIRFDSPNPPLLVHAARAIRTCLMLDNTAAGYAEENLPLSYFTPREGMRPAEDEKKIEALLTKWEQARARRKTGYVGAAWDLKVPGWNAEQIQLADQRQHAVLEIARACGIDPEDLGVSTTSRTYQNAEQRRLDLVDFTLAHYMAAVEQRLSMRDVLPRGYEVKVSLDGFLRSDTLTRMNAYKIGEEVGAYTVQEIRALEDRPPLPKPTVQPVPMPQPGTEPTPPPEGNGQVPTPARNGREVP